MKETDAMKRMRYYKMLNECCAAAIYRLNPLDENFKNDFDELFIEQSDALQKYDAAIEEISLQRKKRK